MQALQIVEYPHPYLNQVEAKISESLQNAALESKINERHATPQ